MKVIFATLLLVAGAFARSAVQDKGTFAEGPSCPIDDPLESPGPGALNVTLDPICTIDLGSIRGDLVAIGLSGLHFEVDIQALLLSATFELNLTSIDVTTTYEATGYVDARPFREETVPQGNFTGKGSAKIVASGLRVKGRASLFINVIGNKVGLLTLNLEVVNFDNADINLENMVVGGKPVDWTTWSSGIKNNFETDWAQHKNAMTDKVRLAANNIIGKYTLAELIDLIGGGGGGGEEPCETH